MSSLDEESDEIYQIPRSSLELDMPVQLRSAALEEAVPPVLMPKKGNGFKRTSSLLDRQVPNAVPSAPPRSSSFNRNSSVDVAEPIDGSPQSVGLIQTSSVKNLDLSNKTSCQTVEAVISKSNEKSDVKNVAAKSPKLQPAVSQQSASSSKNNSDVLDQTAHAPSPKHIARPVPTPKPRTKLSHSATQNVSSYSSTQNTGISTSSALNGLQEQSSMMKTQPGSGTLSSSVVKDKVDLFRMSSLFPPDADSIELMLNDEVDKKYGLYSAQNQDSEHNVIPENGEVSAHSDDSDEYVNPGVLIKGVSLHQEDKQVCKVPVSPKPHSSVPIPSYLQMTNKRKEGQTAGLPLDLPICSPRKSHFPKATTAVFIGSNLLEESSSDDILVSEESPSKGCDANPSPCPTTPKPFNDIKPFRSKVLQHSDAQEKEQEALAQILDFSYFDPLWTDKPTAVQTSHAKLMEQMNSSSLNQAGSDFVVDWSKASAGSKTSDTHSSMYATADDVEGSPEAYCTQIDREFKNTATAGLWRSQQSKLSFHHDAPIAPPPPLPRQQNRIPEPIPPPVPPRPDNGQGVSQPIVVSKLPSITAVSFCTPSTSSDIFHNLPTPVFMQNQSSDPFQNSNFDYECLKFNKTQLPTPPSRIPLPRTPRVKVVEPANEISAATAIDPRMDPERISRFVIPPPGSHERGMNVDDYDLARGVENLLTANEAQSKSCMQDENRSENEEDDIYDGDSV